MSMDFSDPEVANEEVHDYPKTRYYHQNGVIKAKAIVRDEIALNEAARALWDRHWRTMSIEDGPFDGVPKGMTLISDGLKILRTGLDYLEAYPMASDVSDVEDMLEESPVLRLEGLFMRVYDVLLQMGDLVEAYTSSELQADRELKQVIAEFVSLAKQFEDACRDLNTAVAFSAGHFTESWMQFDNQLLPTSTAQLTGISTWTDSKVQTLLAPHIGDKSMILSMIVSHHKEKWLSFTKLVDSPHAGKIKAVRIHALAVSKMNVKMIT